MPGSRRRALPQCWLDLARHLASATADAAATTRASAEALALAAQIAANGPVAVRAAKRAVDQGTEAPLEAGLAIEADCYAEVIPTQDRLEALAAFAEKRKPEFQGR